MKYFSLTNFFYFFFYSFIFFFLFFLEWTKDRIKKHVAAIRAGGGYYKGMPEEDAVKMAKASGGSYKGMPEIEKMRNAMSFGTGPRVQEALELIQGKSTLRVKKKGTKAYPAIDCEVSVEYEPRIEGYVMVVDKTGFVSVKGLCRHLWEKSGRSPNHSDSYKFVYLKKNDKLFQEKLQDGSWNFN